MIIRFLTADLKTSKLVWSDFKKVHPDCLASLTSSQVKRIVKFDNRKIIFLKEKFSLGMIAICVIDN